MKLKTLNDFEEFHNYDFDFEMINKSELKQEAINWIKKFLDNLEYKLAAVLTRFFNITEEELK